LVLCEVVLVEGYEKRLQRLKGKVNAFLLPSTEKISFFLLFFLLFVRLTLACAFFATHNFFSWAENVRSLYLGSACLR
jgi:hypothetical protein